MSPSRALSRFVRRGLSAAAVAALLLVTIGQAPPLAQGDAAAVIARIEAPQTRIARASTVSPFRR